LSHKRAKGEKYGTVPFGYRVVDGRLVEVPEEIKILSDISAMREQGKTLRLRISVCPATHSGFIRPPVPVSSGQFDSSFV
jgi:hypothetical protein